MSPQYDFPVIMNCNAQSIACKVDELSVFMSSHHIDITCITESWLTSHVPDSAISIPGYISIRNDRSICNGGGVCLYIRDTMDYKLWQNLMEDEIESIWLTLQPRKMPRDVPQITIGTIYMPPGCPDRPRKEKLYIAHILKCLDSLTQHHPSTGIMVLGDFNHMNDVQLKRYPLKQTVKSPTHDKSILDCVYTNISSYYSQPTPYPGLGRYRHSIVCCKPLNNIAPNKSSMTLTRRINTHSAKIRFVNDLKIVNWTVLYNLSTVQSQWMCFYNTITSLLNTHLPFKTIKKFDTDKPWVTEDFKSMISIRQSAWKSGNTTKFNIYRNKVNRASKHLRKRYYDRNINGLQHSNPRQWWNKTQTLIGRKSKTNQLVGLCSEQSNGDYMELSEKINNFFHSVSSHLPPLPVPVFNCNDITHQYTISIEEVERVLMNTDISKANGPDDIPRWILRDLAGVISAPICAIFNTSLREGKLPTQWKRADVVPIPKSNPPKSIQSDLRPISLTSVLSKHLESFVGKWILECIEDKLDNTQYGGLRGLSTTHALVDMLQHWHTMIHMHETVRIMFIDYSKAFDSVDHNILLKKFQRLDVPAVIIRWLHDFLHNREQRVKLNNDVSSWLTLNGGVPQGSWLAPLCFIVYISDIHFMGNLIVHKYVDDMTLTESITSPHQSQLQSHFDFMVKWSSDNSMSINSKKTKEMVLSFKLDKLDLPPISSSTSTIERVDSFKLLGTRISNDLSWKLHVEDIYGRASPRLYYLRQLRRCGVHTKDLLMFYKSVIRPILEYACPAWHTSLTQQDSDLLEQIQKRAMYVICPNTPYKDAIISSSLETLYTRRETICKKFFSKIRNEDHKLNYLLMKRREIPYELRHHQPYDFITPHTERFKKSFIMHGLLHYT